MQWRWRVVVAVGCWLAGCSDDGGAPSADSNLTAGEAGTGDGSGPDSAEPESNFDPVASCDDGALAEPLAGCAPPPLPSTGDFQQDCVDRINQLRWECQCLPPLARWRSAEDCTDEQAANDQADGGRHPNFGACSENAQNTCPDWPSEDAIISDCLQDMWDEGPGEPFEAHGHYINMSSLEYTKVACGRSSSGGAVWSNQNFSR